MYDDHIVRRMLRTFKLSEGRRMQFKDVRGGVAIGCLCLLCEGRRTWVVVTTQMFVTEVAFDSGLVISRVEFRGVTSNVWDACMSV